MKTSRRNWWMVLLAPFAAKAQQWKDCEREPSVPALCAADEKGSAKHRPPLPDQCPVCGAMALQLSASQIKALIETPIELLPAQGAHKIITLARCARCNAAFFQDPPGPLWRI